MKRRFALLSALLLGATAEATGSDLLEAVQANLPASTTVVDDLILALTADVPTAPAGAEPRESDEAAPSERPAATESIPQVAPTSESPSEARPPAPKVVAIKEEVPTIAAAPLAPVAAPKPLEVKPAVVVEEERENTKALKEGLKKSTKATKAPAASGRAPQASKAGRIKASKAQAIARPAELPEGWSHISGQIAGSRAINLPQDSKIQLTIEAIDRKTGLHSPHLMVDWHAPALNANYFLNYNAGRLDHANYKYVVQAKVFDRKGKMLHMSASRQALPEQDASRLQIDMNF